ncbi:MAG: Holliday junction resolvase RuvX [Gammaproteobacteria bacterium]
MSQYRTLLGFDYGNKRIGVAVGQELTRTSQALCTLHNHADGPDWAAISRLIQEWQPALLIVGLPHHMDDDRPHPLAARVQDFGKQLEQRYNLPVDWVDERLSSLEAEAQLAGSGKSRADKRDKANIDKLAAAIILQTWLNYQAD